MIKCPKTYISFFLLIFFQLLHSSQPKFLFLNLPLSAKISSLSETVVALHSEPISSLYNPAILATNSFNNFCLSYLHHFENIGAYELFYVKKIMVNIRYFNFSDEMRNMLGEVTGNIFHTYYVFTMGFGEKIKYNLFSGINIKFASQEIIYSETFYENILLYDTGILYIYNNNSYGFSLLNLTSDRSNFPFTVEFGASHMLKNFTFNWKGSKRVDRDLKIACGIEYFVSKSFVLRTGLGYLKFIDFSLGFGVSWKNLIFDYSISPVLTLGVSQRFSLRFNFE